MDKYKVIKRFKTRGEVDKYILDMTTKDCYSFGIFDQKVIEEIIERNPFYGCYPLFTDKDDYLVFKEYVVVDYKRSSFQSFFFFSFANNSPPIIGDPEL